MRCRDEVSCRGRFSLFLFVLPALSCLALGLPDKTKVVTPTRNKACKLLLTARTKGVPYPCGAVPFLFNFKKVPSERAPEKLRFAKMRRIFLGNR